jgi:hypothetical protein
MAFTLVCLFLRRLYKIYVYIFSKTKRCLRAVAVFFSLYLFSHNTPFKITSCPSQLDKEVQMDKEVDGPPPDWLRKTTTMERVLDLEESAKLYLLSYWRKKL